MVSGKKKNNLSQGHERGGGFETKQGKENFKNSGAHGWKTNLFTGGRERRLEGHIIAGKGNIQERAFGKGRIELHDSVKEGKTSQTQGGGRGKGGGHRPAVSKSRHTQKKVQFILRGGREGQGKKDVFEGIMIYCKRGVNTGKGEGKNVC